MPDPPPVLQIAIAGGIVRSAFVLREIVTRRVSIKLKLSDELRKWEPFKLSLNSAISHFTSQSRVNLEHPIEIPVGTGSPTLKLPRDRTELEMNPIIEIPDRTEEVQRPRSVGRIGIGV